MLEQGVYKKYKANQYKLNNTGCTRGKPTRSNGFKKLYDLNLK